MTKFFLGFILFFTPLISIAQFTDDFSDGDFISNPVWSGDDSVYTIVNNALRSNKTIINSTFYLSTPSTIANNSQWEFWVNLKFATSGSNYVDIYLTADQANLKSATLNGYFVRIGGTSDNISLMKKTSGANVGLISGTNGVVASSSNNIIKIKVTRDASNLFTLNREFTTGTLTGNYTTEGTVTDATFTTSAFFGVSVTQSTASFFQKHFFDDFYTGPIILDTTSPTIISSAATSVNTADVLFSESVDQTTAETITNYNVSNTIGTPASAIRDAVNHALVHLSFAGNFTSGTNYIVTVNNVNDIAGNTLAANSTGNFTYMVLEAAASKDLVINEIFADVNPTVGLPASEYVEIYNRSNKFINIGGFKLKDPTNNTGVIQSKIIAPGGYIILTAKADTIEYQAYGTTAYCTTFPTLNDSGDSLWLRDNLGNIIDFMTYTTASYNDPTRSSGGYTLERKNPNDTCIGQSNNWSASNNSIGGTPGIVNSIYNTTPDTQAPTLISATVLTTTSIKVTFNESLDAAIANDISHYVIAGNTVLNAMATGDLSIVVLTLSTSLDTGVIYNITVNGLADCKGNVLTSSSTTFTIFNIIKPYDIVINEIFADPNPTVGLPSSEYFELYNRRSYPLSLKNLRVKISTNSPKTLTDIVIPAYGYVTVCAVSAGSSFSSYGIVSTISSLSLTDDGTTIILLDSSNNVIHTVTYNIDWYHDKNKQDGGYSLEQIDYNNPCGGIENWAASKNPAGGTPGSINSIYSANPDTKQPTLIRASVINNLTIALYYSESLDSLSTLNPLTYTIDNGIGNPISVNPVEPAFTKLILKLAAPIQAGIIYTVTSAANITDCVGQLISTPNSARFAIPESSASGDIVINELLSDPKTDGVDFVEVYNRSNKVIDFKELRLSSYDTIASALTSIKEIDPEGYLIFPGDYVVLTSKPDAVKKQYLTSNENGFIQISSMPSFNIDEGRVVISDVQQNIIDRFDYTESMQFPLLNSSKGVSLERIDFNRETQDKTNWHSASEAVGFATPAYKNSQYFAGENNGDVNLDPEVFSPDNDGYQDNLTINYKMDGPGYVANIDIFDASGRLVKSLIHNSLLGESGTFSWDGINNNGDKARIGIYIIYFSAYNTAGKTVRAKKQCVVASRL